MLFLKEHLEGYYKWTIEPANVLFTGSPTRRIFDRSNGEQVIFIINSIAALSENFSVEEGKKVEDLILNKLPLHVQSELSAFQWLRSKSGN